MGAFFVTGSGTGVGKTYATCRMIEAARAAGTSVSALKPVITGWDQDDPEAVQDSDTGLLLAAQGLDLTPENIDACSAFRYREPLSPDMAAARENPGDNLGIDFDRLVGICAETIENMDQNSVLYIEGVGGVMVPLTDDKTVLDWMTALGIPAILVVGSYLGTLSHTLTAALALRSRDIEIDHIIVSESEESPVPVEETADVIGRHLGNPTIRTLTRK